MDEFSNNMDNLTNKLNTLKELREKYTNLNLSKELGELNTKLDTILKNSEEFIKIYNYNLEIKKNAQDAKYIKILILDMNKEILHITEILTELNEKIDTENEKNRIRNLNNENFKEEYIEELTNIRNINQDTEEEDEDDDTKKVMIPVLCKDGVYDIIRKDDVFTDKERASIKKMRKHIRSQTMIMKYGYTLSQSKKIESEARLSENNDTYLLNHSQQPFVTTAEEDLNFSKDLDERVRRLCKNG